MPPRTGPRRRKRLKQAPAPLRHFAVVLCNDDTASALGRLTTAHRLELDDGNLVLRDDEGAIVRVIARGEWREALQILAADLLPEVIRESEPEPGNHEQVASGSQSTATDATRATLVGDGDPVFPPPQEEADRRFVPTSPEEAQRILRELQRRHDPDPDAAPPTLPRKE